jgi:hypothetical protein
MTPKPRGFTGIEADVMKTTLANISASKRTASGSGYDTIGLQDMTTDAESK